METYFESTDQSNFLICKHSRNLLTNVFLLIDIIAFFLTFPYRSSILLGCCSFSMSNLVL